MCPPWYGLNGEGFQSLANKENEGGFVKDFGGVKISLQRRRSSFSGVTHKNRLSEPEDMSVEAMVQKMIDDLTAALVDAAKHDKGNSAAGTRVRKAMQAAKAAAQDVRKQVQADKNN